MELLKRKLKNGITMLMEKRELPVVSFSITNKFGAGYEESKIKGISHFIEHLVFTGTKTRTHEEISGEIEKRGGILNAFTSNEMTSFWFKLPSEHLFAGMDILIDILKNPKFDAKKFEKEKKVILEEIKMYHDNPQRYVYELVEENMYKKPFGEGIIGSKETISALNRDFVFDYFKKMYSPENFVITLVGNADFEKVCLHIEKSFIAGERKLKPLNIVKKNSKSIEGRGGLDQAHYLFAIHAPLPGTKEFYALEVLNAYLADGMSSKIFLKVREERGLAYAVRGAINAEKDYCYYSIYVGTLKAAIPEVEKIILEEFEKAKKMSAKELREAKERVIGLRKVGSEESSNVMSELVFHELVGNAEDYYRYEENVNKVTMEDMRKVATIKEYSSAAIVPK